jgi:hypothetical protein
MLFNKVDFSNPRESYPSCPMKMLCISWWVWLIFFFMLINNVIQQNGLLQPTRVISILPCFIYFILYINKSYYSTKWTSPTRKSHIHPALWRHCVFLDGYVLFILSYINKSCYSTKWTSPTRKSHIHPALWRCCVFLDGYGLLILFYINK